MATLPPPVHPGDRIGVAALSGAVDRERLRAGVAALKGMGFEVELADNLEAAHGPLAGTDAERVEGFHRLVADPSVKGVIFARGGYGLTRILPAIDFELIAKHPRAYVGFSDLTPLLLAIVQRLGMVTFHGPMVAGQIADGLDEAERESLLGVLAGELPVEIEVGEWLCGGDAEGVLLGGCLSMLTAVVGTPWAPNLTGAVLFLEDVVEPAYRVDRMLTHLRLSGNLADVHATAFGHFDGQSDEGVSADWHRDTLLAMPKPVVAGLACGHGRPNLTLPMGVPARLDAARGRLRIG